MRLLFTLFAVVVGASAPTGAHAAEPPPPPPPAAARAGFRAQLWVVEGREFFRDWKAGHREPRPLPECAREASGGLPVFAAVTFAGPGSDAYGLAHVRWDLRVLRPDGTVYARQPDALASRGWAGPCALLPQLGRDAAGFVPERGDPPGFYLVEARVRDVVAGVELPVLRASFLVR